MIPSKLGLSITKFNMLIIKIEMLYKLNMSSLENLIPNLVNTLTYYST